MRDHLDESCGSVLSFGVVCFYFFILCKKFFRLGSEKVKIINFSFSNDSDKHVISPRAFILICGYENRETN